MTPKQAQVLHGFWVSGPHVHYPHNSKDTLAFYREMVGGGLLSEYDMGEGKTRFAITVEGTRVAEAECERVREILDRARKEIG